MHKLWLLASTAGKGLLQCVLIVALTFLFCRTIPGDAVDVLGLEGGLTAEQAAAIRQALKLDDPWLVQFGDWLSAASRHAAACRLGICAGALPRARSFTLGGCASVSLR